jgi:hypothetical protein
METENFIKIVKNSHSKSDVCRQLGWPINGTHLRKVSNLISNLKIDISHFDSGASKRRKYENIIKECPLCRKQFNTTKNKREKTTCSHSCSNTYYRSNKNNPNWKESSYRTTCFLYHIKKCVICDEVNIVTVHHYDENRNNNNPINLIPLCPTHHQYMHSSYKYMIEDVVESYRNNFILDGKRKPLPLGGGSSKIT